jgi:hypothetical protein
LPPHSSIGCHVIAYRFGPMPKPPVLVFIHNVKNHALWAWSEFNGFAS